MTYTTVVHLENLDRCSWMSNCLTASVFSTYVILTSGSPTSSSDVTWFVAISLSHKNLGPETQFELMSLATLRPLKAWSVGFSLVLT